MLHGALLGGAIVSFSMVCTTPDTPASISWTITGTKGALKFEGLNCNIQILPPTLYRFSGGAGSAGDVGWEEIAVEKSRYYGQVDHLYQAFTEGEKVPGSLVDFEGAARRHRLVEACAESSKDGMRRSYM